MQNDNSKLKDFLKSRKFKVFLLVLVLGLSLFGYGVKEDAEKKQQALEPVPTPTVSYLERQQKKLEAINELPYQGEIFNIEYFPQDDTFWVKIKKNPYTENQNIALNWFADRGIDPQNINIHWTSVRGVAP